jgi:hypothetical protein
MAAQKVVEASSAVEDTRLPLERTCKRGKASVATQKASGTPQQWQLMLDRLPRRSMRKGSPFGHPDAALPDPCWIATYRAM